MDDKELIRGGERQTVEKIVAWLCKDGDEIDIGYAASIEAREWK